MRRKKHNIKQLSVNNTQCSNGMRLELHSKHVDIMGYLILAVLDTRLTGFSGQSDTVANIRTTLAGFVRL